MTDNKNTKANAQPKTVKVANVQPVTYVIDQYGVLQAVHKLSLSETISLYAAKGK